MTSTTTATESSELSPTEQAAVLRKVTLKLIPFLFLLYIVAYLDRVNVSIAQLQMQKALGFSDSVYGIGSGIFFIGYFFFEVPSNLLLARFGARRWIARIMVTWGVLAMAMAFAFNVPTFYILRFILGLGEAGFFPGVILYLTFWFTRAERGRIVALFMTATVVSNIIGAPISGLLLNIHGPGFAGWQSLFIIEGIPAVLLAGVVLTYLPDGPQDARWLTQAERDWLTNRVANEDRSVGGHHRFKDIFLHPRVLQMSLLYLAIVISNYGYTFWLPKIIKSFGKLTDQTVSFITAVPYIFAVIGMVLIGMHSDAKRERRLHVAGCSLVGSLGLFLAARNLNNPVLCIACFSLAAIGMWGTLGPFWGLSTAFLAGTGAAGAIALINSIGNLGGFFGPYLMGALKDRTHGFDTGILTLSASCFVAACIAFMSHRENLPSPHPTTEATEESTRIGNQLPGPYSNE